MRKPTEGQVAKTEFGLCQIITVDNEAKAVRVKHFVAKTPVTDFRFSEIQVPELKNSDIKAILVENKIVGKVTGTFAKRIDIKKESDLGKVSKLFPTYTITYGFFK